MGGNEEEKRKRRRGRENDEFKRCTGPLEQCHGRQSPTVLEHLVRIGKEMYDILIPRGLRVSVKLT